MLHRSRLTRRGFIRLAGGATLLALVNTVRWPDYTLASTPTAQSEWTIDGSQISGRDFATDPLAPNHQFTAVTASWQGPQSAPDALAIDISVLDDEGVWMDWKPLQRDSHIPASSDGWRHYLPLLQPGTDVRVRVSAQNVPSIEQLRISVIDTTKPERDLEQENPNERLDDFVIPRSEWGAQESFVHIDQDVDKPLAWPPEYAPVHKVIIHHTDTEAGWDDPAAIVRAIYYYHAVILDWGDIGYNFLVDWGGNIYEGRYGGPNVVGGHALQFNRGSMGIALIGNYSGMEPTPAAFEALTRLIASRAPQVDARLRTDWFTWANVPNILGHGDVINTACPGTELHGLLPALRGNLAGTEPIYFPKPIPLELPRIIDFSVSPTTVAPGDLVEVRATITNDGRDPLLSQGPEPGFIYDEESDYELAGYPKQDGAYRLAVGISDHDGPLRPFRWGFGAPLAQAEIREIVGYIRMSSFGEKTFAASVLKENFQYFDQDRLPQSIHTLHPQVQRAAATGEATTLYFQETGHNVPEPFASYWQNRGGLERFGFPLTEPFNEESETDGETYLTQYFERARFEWHPDFAGSEYEVQLGLLGTERTLDRRKEPAFQKIEPFESTSELAYFPETGHSTSYRFLEVWKARGGVAIFGFPISEKFEELSKTDGKIHLIQYFERNRFEYHPDEPDYDKQIMFGHLGREVLIDRGWIPGAPED